MKLLLFVAFLACAACFVSAATYRKHAHTDTEAQWDLQVSHLC